MFLVLFNFHGVIRKNNLILLKETGKYFARRRMSAAAGNSSKFSIQEVEGDLFTAPKTHSLAHCVGADMAMGAGIAVKFKQTFWQIDELLAQNAGSGDVAILKDQNRYIYYLVTKEFSYAKPTYTDLRSSLIAMRNHMCDNDVKHLAIPRIGCGIDGLEWDKVQAELTNVFGKEEVEIVVYNFVPK